MSYSGARSLFLAVAMSVFFGAASEAQHFGSNKVQYEDFDFRILQTEHFDIYYYPREEDAIVYVARLAERWYARLSEALEHELDGRQPLILYASHSDFRQTNLISGTPSESTGGLTEGLKRRIVMPLGVGLGETNHVLGHELVHAFQYDIAREYKVGLLGIPLWFIEGMAEHLSLGPDGGQTDMWMRDAIRRDELPSIEDLSHPRYFPYRWGHSFWSYLAGRFGDDVVPRLLKVRSSRMAQRLHSVTGVTLEQLSKDWHKALREIHGGREAEGGEKGRRVVSRKDGGRLNLAPSLSPDGRHVVFLSERDRFSIDVYLADAITGKVLRKIISTATDPHFDSLQFVGSAGAWDPSGRRFALAAVSGGRPVLVLLDMERYEVEREIRFEQLDEVLQPAWSPDGKKLAFAALSGGLSDLYVQDLETGDLRRLTSDPFADVQPSWSPDGARLVFVTDRYTTDLETLAFGPYRLATMVLADGSLSEVRTTGPGHVVSPQWSAEGDSLFFVSDPEGRPNVQRLDLAGGGVYQVTEVETGVSGITSLSPALSVAAGGSRIAFSAFAEGGYEIRSLDEAEAISGDPVALEALRNGDLPPGATGAGAASGEDEPGGRLASAEWLDASRFTVKHYRPSLTLDGIGQPYVSAGGGPFGSFFRAGIGFSLGDMLRDQRVHVAVQAGRRPEDFAGRVTYLNRRSRWNWGVSLEYLPVAYGRRGTSSAFTPDGQQTMASTLDYFTQTHRQVSAIAMYPFNRATRIELSGSLRSIAYYEEARVKTFAPGSSRIIDETRNVLPAPDSVNLVEGSLAIVHDTAVLGPTSPILGTRSRLEVGPSFGSLSFATVVADYRRYVIPVKPFTLAFRGRYVGRHGGDAADGRLLPLVLGLRHQVRGYSVRSVLDVECEPGTGCSPFEALSGSRLLLGNVELRFPLRGLLSRRFDYGPLPVEGFLFADAGSLWTRTGPAADAAWERNLLRSWGAGVRINAAGMILELAGARPFDRPGEGWTFSLNLGAGF